MRLLLGIAAFTTFCMFAVAVVTDHLADICLSSSTVSQSSRIHLISEVTQGLKRVQESRAGYLATGKASYLDACRAASAEVDASMDRLVSEDYEVTTKLAHAQGLRQLVHAKLSEIGKALESGPVAQAPATVPAVDGDLLRIRRLLDDLAQEESRDISGQLEEASARTIFHRNLAVAVAVINLLFLGGITVCAIQIRKLYSLITICAWSKRVQYRGQWVPLEQYINMRFGIRISHGISQEEYEKWAALDMAGEQPPGERPASRPLPVRTGTPKAAA